MQVETRIDCPLTKLQTFWYRRLLLKDARALLSLESQAAQDNIKASQLFTLSLDHLSSSMGAVQALQPRLLPAQMIWLHSFHISPSMSLLPSIKAGCIACLLYEKVCNMASWYCCMAYLPAFLDSQHCMKARE